MSNEKSSFLKCVTSNINAKNEDVWSFKTLFRFILRVNLKVTKRFLSLI
jgi:hypothetical protein